MRVKDLPPRVCDTCGVEKNVSSYRPQGTATTCRQCQRAQEGWDKNEPKLCDTCGETKGRRSYASASATTCSVCSKGSRVQSAPPEVKERLEHKAAVKEEVRKVRKKTGTAPTPRQVSAIDKELAARVLSRRRLLPFIQRFNPDYQAGWVHHDICRRLERFAEQIDAKQSPRLMLLMPPRHGKSEIASRNFPAWYLGPRPKHEVVASSHTGSLALDFSRRVREIARDPSYSSVFPDMRLAPDTQALEKWMTTAGGSYTAVGVGGSLTGKGAHCLLIDDPVKDLSEADSQTIRDSIFGWYGSTARTRLAPGGGVLLIQCMTGDTPVLMADGSQRRLDALTPSDRVGTYKNGRLGTAAIKGFRSNGRDSVFRITTNSGRIVRANQRHPFLVQTPGGDLKWVRLRALTTDHTIVVLKDSAGSGKGLLAPLTGATNPPNAAVCVTTTTNERSGLTDIAHPARSTRTGVAARSSNIGTALPSPITTACSLSRAGFARFVGTPQALLIRTTGRTSSPLTTATTQERYADSCATTAMPESDILDLSPWHLPQPGISDFTLESIASVEYDGVEDVFDVQVEGTENFIANGTVSHNTWWNDDDLAGRLQAAMKEGGEQFEVVKYPAINEGYDEYLAPDDAIVQVFPNEAAPKGSRLLRRADSALHAERYDLKELRALKSSYESAGQKRIWSALYQQNPIPDEGLHFTKDMFQWYDDAPDLSDARIIQAWDFAITEKQASDWTVGICIAQLPDDDLYVLDMRRFRSGDSIAIVDTLIDFFRRHKAFVLGVEDGQIWKAMAALFQKRCREERIYPNLHLNRPLTDKQVRASPLRGRMQQGKVFFPRKAQWVGALEQELLRFPAGKHDDTVDALAWAVQTALNFIAPTTTRREPQLKSWRDKLRGLTGGGGGGAMSA